MPGKRKSERLCRIFAEGAGGEVVSDGRLRPGPAAFYGVHERSKALFDAVRRAKEQERRDWYYIDNGYFAPSRFFRVTRNALQHDGLAGKPDHDRLKALGLTIRPWRDSGRHVLLCLQSERYMRLLWDLDGEAWTRQTRAAIARLTERPVRVRRKGDRQPIGAALENCHVAVGFTSNALVEALLAGVPAIALGPCAARAMGGGELRDFEIPPMPDGRADWAARLAAKQWTVEEIRDGVAWRALTGSS